MCYQKGQWDDALLSSTVTSSAEAAVTCVSIVSCSEFNSILNYFLQEHRVSESVKVLWQRKKSPVSGGLPGVNCGVM